MAPSPPGGSGKHGETTEAPGNEVYKGDPGERLIATSNASSRETWPKGENLCIACK